MGLFTRIQKAMSTSQRNRQQRPRAARLERASAACPPSFDPLESRELMSASWQWPMGSYGLAAMGLFAAPTAAVAPADYAGNSLSSARQMGTLSGSQSYSDFVGKADRDDYYRFSLGSTRTVSLALTGMTADADLYLLNSSGKTVTSSTRDGAADEQISRSLSAGTYYLRVTRYSGDTNYRLSASATPPDAAGNTLSTARSLGTVATSWSGSDFVGAADTDDYYRFGLAGASQVAVTVSNLLANADLQVLNDAGQVLTVSTQAGTTSESVSLTLNAGNYYLRVLRNTGDTTYQLSLNVTAVTPPAPGDWYASNLRDAGLLSTARSAGADGSLSRLDMIGIFRAAGSDDGLVDATELADLRAIVGAASTLGITDPIRVLSSKVANGDPANRAYQGTTLGNLAAGSSSAQLDKLVNKWFYGSDRPTTSYAYAYAQGSLFVNGAAYTDIVQGALGDCYYLAALSETALRSPTTITSMFTDNGDGTFIVRLYNGQTADYITVDRYLPSSGGRFIYANYGGYLSNTGNELWVALAEKAYAQINEAGWIGHGTTNSYAAIEGGYTGLAIQHVTAKSTIWAGLDWNGLVTAFNAGKLVAFSSKSSGTTNGVIASHAYALVSVDSAAQQVTLYNPWGSNITLTWSQVQANYAGWYRTA